VWYWSHARKGSQTKRFMQQKSQLQPISTRLDSLAAKESHFETLIVGGGIVGAGIFRDLSLHGIDSLLVDAKDFASQTSSKSSKMLHGGIRYLETFDFPLVYEALHEKNLWLKIAPHLAREAPFILPVYKGQDRPLWMIRCGLTLYDLLSGNQNTPHKILSKTETLKQVPILQQQGLTGAGQYFDGIVDDCRMNLEVIFDGLYSFTSKSGHGKQSRAINHAKASGMIRKNNLWQVELEDEFSGHKRQVTCNFLVLATGPFTDKLLDKELQQQWSSKLLPNRGVHLWIDKLHLPIDNPLVIPGHDNRIVFVIPHPTGVLVGTTEAHVDDKLFDLIPRKSEVDYLLKLLQEYFPHHTINEESILSTFCGIRPLVREENTLDLSKTAREHKVYYPAENMMVIMGGKYTTFRVMGQEISRRIVEANGTSYSPLRSLSPMRFTSSWKEEQKRLPLKHELETILKFENPRTFDDLVRRRLGFNSTAHWNMGAQYSSKSDRKNNFESYFLSHIDLLNRFLSENGQIKIEQAIRNFDQPLWI